MSPPTPPDPSPPSTPDGRFHDSGGDTHFLPEGELPGDARLYAPGDGAWPRKFAPLPADPLPVRRLQKPVVVAGAVALVVVAVGGLVFWLLRPSPATPSSPATNPTTSTTSASPSPDVDAQALMRLLPPGYPGGSCKPVAAPKAALAVVNCDKNSDPGGPLSATYTLVRDKVALDAALNDIVQGSATVICPGNIQSPGPWRRNATSEQVSGVLYCGIQEGRPTVAWTDNGELLLSAVQTGPQGPTFPQLYAWWSTHS